MQKREIDGEHDKLLAAWSALQEAAPIGPIRNERHHARLLELYDVVSAQVGERRSHPLAGLLSILVGLIRDYEAETHPIADVEPKEALRFLMEQHDLKQSDLAKELGSQGVVSEILRGKREINARQARALAKRFNVLPMSFI